MKNKILVLFIAVLSFTLSACATSAVDRTTASGSFSAVDTIKALQTVSGYHAPGGYKGKTQSGSDCLVDLSDGNTSWYANVYNGATRKIPGNQVYGFSIWVPNSSAFGGKAGKDEEARRHFTIHNVTQTANEIQVQILDKEAHDSYPKPIAEEIGFHYVGGNDGYPTSVSVTNSHGTLTCSALQPLSRGGDGNPIWP